MPKTLDSYLADRALTRQLYLMRFSAGEKKKVLAVLTQMQKELRLKLLNDLTDFSKARVNKLLSESTAIIEAAYKEMTPDAVVKIKGPAFVYHATNNLGELNIGRDKYVSFTEADGLKWKNAKGYKYLVKIENTGFEIIEGTYPTTGTIAASDISRAAVAVKGGWEPIKSLDASSDKSTDLLGLARHEAQATASTFAAIGLEASLPTEAVLKAMVSDTLLQGAPLKDWWAKQSADTAFKFSAQVRQGVAQGETLQQVITRIVGSKKKGIVGIMEISHRHASTLIHDSIMQIANDARMATYKANADIMKGFEWLATLDGNTCVQCMAYSGAQWDMEGKPIKGDLPLKNPPLHPNCRCVLTPLTKSYRELGLNIDEMPPGTRASDLGPVPADMTMDAFLKRHDTEYLNDLLGPGRAKLFQDGKITLSQLVDGTGRELTLKELKALAAK